MKPLIQKLGILMAMLSAFLSASAYDFEVDGIYYSVLDGNQSCEVVSVYIKYSGDIVIPSEVTFRNKVLTVTEIGEEAFYYCTSITSIELPNSVTDIGHSAFYGCTSLTSIELPNSVTDIGHSAFYGCTSLTSIKLPNSVTKIRFDAFRGCTSLTSIEIPNSVTGIGDSAFYGCTSITSIEIPNSVTDIERYAFGGCTSLTSIEISNSVKMIKDCVFGGCTSLTSIEIPNSVTYIGWSAFRGCTSLTSIEIPNSVTGIGDSAFRGCTSLTSIEIPNSVTGIGDSAFSDCTSLTSIEIPNPVKMIKDYVFSGCTSLISIEIPNSVLKIGSGAFRSCTSLESIEIPHSVTEISNEAFKNCTSLTSIEIPNSVNYIYWEAFANTNIREVTFEKGANSIVFVALKYNYSYAEAFNTSPTKVNIGRGVQICYTENTVPYEIREGSFDEHFPPKSWESSMEELTVNVDFDKKATSNFMTFNKLKTLNIGEDVNYIYYLDFSKNSLRDITCLASIPPGGCNFSSNTYEYGTLYVPESSIEAYQKADGWKNFFKIKAIEQTGIEDVEVDSESCQPDVIYDLMGRRLTEPQPGFNIINGKKVYVK